MLTIEKDQKTGHPRISSLYKSKLRMIDKVPKAITSEQPVQPDQAEPDAKITPAGPLYANISGIVWSSVLKAALEISEVQEANKAKMSKTAVLKASTLLNPLTAYVELNGFIPKPEAFIRYFGEEFKEPTQLILRTRQPGDRFQPLGMTGSMPLKKYLINKAVPAGDRDQLPLLAFGRDILWIPGIAVSDKIKVRTEPTHRLTLEYTETEPLPTDTLLPDELPEPEALLKPVLQDGTEADIADAAEAPEAERSAVAIATEPESLSESLEDLLRDTETLTTDGDPDDDNDDETEFLIDEDPA